MSSVTLALFDMQTRRVSHTVIDRGEGIKIAPIFIGFKSPDPHIYDRIIVSAYHD